MPKLTPDDADRIFSSRVDESDPELGSLVAFVREVRDTYTRAPDAHTQARHLRAMAEEFAAAPAPSSSRRPRKAARRAVVAGLVGGLLVGGGALAATGHLPTPAQDAVASAVEHVGLNIPRAANSSATGQENAEAGQARAAANSARAKAFTDAKKLWTACVAQKASGHTGPGQFDPEAPVAEGGCGPKPQAQDYQPTRTNPAGNENHGKGPEPKGEKPDTAGPKEDPGQGRGQGNPHSRPAGPAGGTGPVDAPGNSAGHSRSNGPQAR